MMRLARCKIAQPLFKSVEDYQADLNTFVVETIYPRIREHGYSLLNSHVEFACERAFLSVSIAESRVQKNPTLLIDFGVHDENDRKHLGVFSAEWDLNAAKTGAVECMCFRGEFCGMDTFVSRMFDYTELPFVLCDGSEPFSDVE